MKEFDKVIGYDGVKAELPKSILYDMFLRVIL